MNRMNGKRYEWVVTAVILAALCLAGAQPATVSAQATKQLTVERIWGQPSLSGTLLQGLQWSPDGKWLSYFQRMGRGRDAQSEIWVMEAATGEKKVLVAADKLGSLFAPPAEPTRPAAATQPTGLGRLTPQRYFWAPDGQAMLIALQGGLYWFDVKTQAGKKLTSGEGAVRDPKISPDGKWVSFVREHNVWVVGVADGAEKQLTEDGREELLQGELDWVYPEELSINTAYWWSPDSKQIAFLEMDQRPVTKFPLVNFLSVTGETVTMRYPKAGDPNPIVRVGVVAATGGTPAWMDTGAEKDIYLARVDWLTDGKRLAIQRMNRAQNQLDLLFADAATGKSQAVLTEKDRYWVNVQDGLYFFADGKKFLWESERDGFNHIYLYGIDGKLVRQVTKGNWEVTQRRGMDEKNGLIYYESTEKSPIERQLYRISLNGGEATRLTKLDGTHSADMSPDMAYFRDNHSTAMTPTKQSLHRADGALVTMINDNAIGELAEFQRSPVEFSTITSPEGTKFHTMMVKPASFDATKKYPVLVYIYGGPHSQIVRDTWGGQNALWMQMMAQKGIIIFGLDNRGMAGRGHAFEAPVHRRMGEIELADQLVGVNHLKSLPYVDGNRIGIWGWSYGGYMTCYAMFNAADVFKAGFAGAPVTDWKNYDTIYTERYMGTPQNNAEGYKNSAPLTHAGKLKGKLLVAHGTGDDNVHFTNSVQLMEEIIRAGKDAELKIYPARGHGIGDAPARIQLFRRVTQFFLDNL